MVVSPPPHPLRCTIFLDPKHSCHGDTGKPAIKAGLTGLGISYSSNPKQNELRVKAKRRHPSFLDMVVGGGGGRRRRVVGCWSHYSIKKLSTLSKSRCWTSLFLEFITVPECLSFTLIRDRTGNLLYN